MIDPPEGWKYGFPKPLPDDWAPSDDSYSTNEWLVSQGYPQMLIDKYQGKLYCRFWERGTDEDGIQT